MRLLHPLYSRVCCFGFPDFRPSPVFLKIMSKRAKRCIFPGCGNNDLSHPELQFFCLPANALTRKKWCDAMGLDVLKGACRLVCETHFSLQEDMENYMQWKTIGSLVKWKPHVVPGNPFGTSSQLTNSAKKRKMETLSALKSSRPPALTSSSAPASSEYAIVVSDSDPSDTEPLHSSLLEDCPSGSTDQTVEASSPLASPLHSSESLVKVVSRYSVEALNEVSRERMVKLITLDPRHFLGVPKSEFRIIKLAADAAKVSERDVMLTLKKIRMNSSNKTLGYDFGISLAQAGKIFASTVVKLSALFHQFVYWPPAEVIQMLMPLQFRQRFRKVQAIIDCFEIQIEKPSTPKLQALTWSDYKKCNTVKVLISATPYGFINYVSPAYGGRISDQEIVTKCGFLTLLPNGCNVLADRGFKQIEGLLAEKNVTLIRPASVKASEKPTKAEIRSSKIIAATRIHIERVISRVREFRFLGPHSTIDKSLVRNVDHAVSIAAGIINLQGSIIKS